ncbi:hypothetical protein BKA62DRAFT_489449 [Auriculariales sp. MPI-PUGE-AT-0066]|nr:hypothetical protein BKA62DRAFT_489449 [Auriculariales sp. MPI-PUGE-AT-0066]
MSAHRITRAVDHALSLVHTDTATMAREGKHWISDPAGISVGDESIWRSTRSVAVLINALASTGFVATVTNAAHVSVAHCAASIHFVGRISARLPISLLLSFFAFRHVSAVQAAFTHNTVYRLDSVRQNYAGTFCFYPGVLVSERPCADSRLQSVLDAHVNNALGSGLSIAYYSTEDGAILGGAEWNAWNTTTLRVALCLSGAVNYLPNAFVSTCHYSMRDDDFEDPQARASECAVNLPQQRVTDGCYPASPLPAPGPRHRLSGAEIFGIVASSVGLLSSALGIYMWVQRRRRRAGAVNGTHDLPLEERRSSTEDPDDANMRSPTSRPTSDTTHAVES